MIVSPDFVFVHLSKTGGTFAADNIREVLCPTRYGRKLHRLKTREGLRVWLPFYTYKYDELDMHALCNDIPEEHRDKPIVSCIRNPFDLYVSEYTYGWWKQYPERWFYDLAAVEKQYPHWRNWSFDEFILLSNQYAKWVSEVRQSYPQAVGLGWYSQKFIYYYCRDHHYVFEAAANPQLLMKRVEESLYPVHFLHTERLNDELYSFLLGRGYSHERIAFILSKDKVKSSRKSYDYREWYDEPLRQEIERRDALILQMFPEYQFNETASHAAKSRT